MEAMIFVTVPPGILCILVCISQDALNSLGARGYEITIII